MTMADLTHLAGRTILVTGGRGFLGSNLCGRLAELGVVLHATTTARTPENSPGIRWHRVDFTDVSDVRDLLGQLHPEIVFHLAGHGVGAPGIDQVLPTFHHDLAGAVNLLTTVAERKSTRRVILAASLEEPTAADAHIPAAT